MPDLTGLPALDLAIGLAFIFFLLATLALTIQEFLAAILGLRARTLEDGLRSMLEDPERGWAYVDAFYDHELVRSLYKTPPPAVTSAKPVAAAAPAAAAPAGRNAKRSRPLRTKGPSYLAPRTFAVVLLDTLTDHGEKDLFADADAVLDQLPARLRRRIEPLVTGPQMTVAKARENLEKWFDDTMARVSGWYKRKTQVILIVIGAVLVVAVNANSLTMAQRMWKDDAVRSAVVAQAQAQAAATPAPDATPVPAAQRLNDAADGVDGVVKVGIPMGWSGDAVPHGAGRWLLAILGWLLTICAISLGAPFWFDTLSRFSRLRSSGKPETPLPASGHGLPNERVS